MQVFRHQARGWDAHPKCFSRSSGPPAGFFSLCRSTGMPSSASSVSAVLPVKMEGSSAA